MNHKDVLSLLQRYRLYTKKTLGQNFLTSPPIVEKIVSLVSDQFPIIEVGPGIGALTSRLMTKNQVLAFEIDRRLEPLLRGEYGEERVTWVFQDFLEVALSDYLVPQQLYSFVSNLPYYITTPIFFRLFEHYQSFAQIILMMQKEVGERFLASVGSANYGSLTVIAQYRFHITKAFVLNKNHFHPRPQVDSMVVVMTPRSPLLEGELETAFFHLVRHSFRMRRKTLVNNLKSLHPQITSVLEGLGLSVDVRPQALSIEQFIALFHAIQGEVIDG